MSKRTASTFKPDMDTLGVTPQDIIDNCIESRHLADNEFDASAIATISSYTGVPVVFQYDVTTGAASIDIFDADAPFKFMVVDVIVEPRGASANGTITIKDGTDAITNAMTCAVDKTIARATTIDNAKSTIAAGGSLEIVCAGDTVASTIALVTIIAVKLD